jgi:hypothetical protein
MHPRRGSNGSAPAADIPAAKGERRPSGAGAKKLQTAVRQLKPQELFALQAENERLLQWEQKLMERAAALEEAASSGGGGDTAELVTRLEAQNKELRASLDMAMLNAGGAGGSGNCSEEAAELRKALRELEARRILERSEEAARIGMEQAAVREAQAAHDATASRLLTVEQSHEHATKLLGSLQASHDEAVAARSAIERERDHLADLLAAQMKMRDAMRGEGAPGAAEEDGEGLREAELRVREAELRRQVDEEAAAAARERQHSLVLAFELQRDEVSLLEASNSARLLEEAARRSEAAAAEAQAQSERNVTRAVEQVHLALEESRRGELSHRLLAAELAEAEAGAALCLELGERCKASRAETEAAALEVWRHEEAAAKTMQRLDELEARNAELDAANAELRARVAAMSEGFERAQQQAARLPKALTELEAARLEAAEKGTAVAQLQAEAREVEARHEVALKKAVQQHREAGRVREAVLKEAVSRAERYRGEVEELHLQAEEAAGDEEAARSGEELALGQVARLEKKLEAATKELCRRDDQLHAMARRLEALAHTSTESHMHDMGYWSERSKRADFATAAYTVGSSKRAAQKVAASAVRRIGEIGAAAAGPAAAAVGGPGAARSGPGGGRAAPLSRKDENALHLPPIKSP